MGLCFLLLGIVPVEAGGCQTDLHCEAPPWLPGRGGLCGGQARIKGNSCRVDALSGIPVVMAPEWQLERWKENTQSLAVELGWGWWRKERSRW